MKWLSTLLSRVFKVSPDPIYNCPLSKECAHVDGMLCNTLTCEEKGKYEKVLADYKTLRATYLNLLVSRDKLLTRIDALEKGQFDNIPLESSEVAAMEIDNMLKEHIEKGDPVDVANFCMMLWNNNQMIAKESNG